MICDGCNVNEGWEHKCHSRSGQEDMMIRGERYHAFCSCEECVSDNPCLCPDSFIQNGVPTHSCPQHHVQAREWPEV